MKKKIYVSHAASFNFKDDLYNPIRTSDLNEQFDIILPHESSEKPFNSKEGLKDCSFVIAEVSYPSTGQGIELGWADLYNIPIVCIYKKDAKVSRSLCVISDTFIEYSPSVNLIDKLKEYFTGKAS